MGALRRRGWTQAHDISAEQPEKLHQLQRLFLIEAVEYNVLPLDDRRVERFNSDLAGRPQLVRGTAPDLFGGMGRLSENSVVVIKNKSHAITAEIDVPEEGGEGVIVAQGGAFGGWSLYAREGKPAYCYNLFGLSASRSTARSRSAASTSASRVRLRRRRARQGRHCVALPRRRQGGRGTGRGDRADALLGRRDPRHRLGQRHPGPDDLAWAS